MTKRPVPSSCARARVADLMITLAKKSTAFGEITILKSRALTFIAREIGGRARPTAMA